MPPEMLMFRPVAPALRLTLPLVSARVSLATPPEKTLTRPPLPPTVAPTSAPPALILSSPPEVTTVANAVALPPTVSVAALPLPVSSTS